MPSLQACGRRWNVASDDFYLPSLVEGTCRTAWLISAAVPFWKNQDLWVCSGNWSTFVYLAGAQVFFGLVTFLDVPQILISKRGSPVRVSARRYLVPLLYFRAFLLAAEVCWHVFGTVLLFYQDDCLPRNLYGTLQTLVIGAWVTDLILVGLVYLAYEPSGSLKHNPVRDLGDLEACDDVRRLFLTHTEKSQRRRRRAWFGRTAKYCCCVGQHPERNEAFQEVAHMMANYHEDVDLAPSDFFSGFCLIRKKQRRLQALTGFTSEVPPPPSALIPYGKYTGKRPVTTVANGTKAAANGMAPTANGLVTDKNYEAPSWMTAENALYFLRFAWGSYGWPSYMASHLCTGLCDLWSGIRCCSCFRGSNDQLTGDNCCECHMATVKHLTKVPPEDLIFSSFENAIYTVPFYVAVDHRTESVMVVVRGTLSTDDIITDFNGLLQEFPEGGGTFHKGVLRSTQHIMGLLEEPLARGTAKHPTYNVVITGHSLGGGIAALLALFLKPRYPGLRCYAFSPPAGVVDIARSKTMRDFVLTIVVGDDLVPRMSLKQIYQLKREVIACLLEYDMPKDDLNSKGMEALFCGSRITPKLTDVDAFDHIGAPTGKLAPSLQCKPKPGARPATIEEILERGVPKKSFPEMLVPGRILHLVRSEHGYQMFWAAQEYFDHIVISPNMLKDHLPDVIQHALKSATNSTDL